MDLIALHSLIRNLVAFIQWLRLCYHYKFNFSCNIYTVIMDNYITICDYAKLYLHSILQRIMKYCFRIFKFMITTMVATHNQSILTGAIFTHSIFCLLAFLIDTKRLRSMEKIFCCIVNKIQKIFLETQNKRYTASRPHACGCEFSKKFFGCGLCVCL